MTDRASRFRFSGSSVLVVALVVLAVTAGCSSDEATSGGPGDGGKGADADGGNACVATHPEPLPVNEAGVCPDQAPSARAFFPCDVEAVVKAKCQRCHNSTDVLAGCSKKTPATSTTPEIPPSCVSGPFPLLEWTDTRKPFPGSTLRPIDLMREAIEGDFMPLQVTSIEPPVEKLTPDEKQTLLDWIDGCGPAADKACACAR